MTWEATQASRERAPVLLVPLVCHWCLGCKGLCFCFWQNKTRGSLEVFKIIFNHRKIVFSKGYKNNFGTKKDRNKEAEKWEKFLKVKFLKWEPQDNKNLKVKPWISDFYILLYSKNKKLEPDKDSDSLNFSCFESWFSGRKLANKQNYACVQFSRKGATAKPFKIYGWRELEGHRTATGENPGGSVRCGITAIPSLQQRPHFAHSISSHFFFYKKQHHKGKPRSIRKRGGTGLRIRKWKAECLGNF